MVAIALTDTGNIGRAKQVYHGPFPVTFSQSYYFAGSGPKIQPSLRRNSRVRPAICRECLTFGSFPLICGPRVPRCGARRACGALRDLPQSVRDATHLSDWTKI